MSDTVRILISPAVMSTKECHAYVGGKPIFDELLAAHGDLLKPLRTTERGDTYYRTKTVDAALSVSEQSGTLIKPQKRKIHLTLFKWLGRSVPARLRDNLSLIFLIFSLGTRHFSLVTFSMTTFIDGPAQGEVLQLRRAPLFLRVTQNGITFDALDQLGDEPAETEIIYVYQICERPAGMVTTTTGVYPIARYRFFDPQPADAQVRQDHAWKGWTTRTWNTLKASH